MKLLSRLPRSACHAASPATEAAGIHGLKTQEVEVIPGRTVDLDRAPCIVPAPDCNADDVQSPLEAEELVIDEWLAADRSRQRAEVLLEVDRETGLDGCGDHVPSGGSLCR